MNFKKFISGVSAFAIAASAFVSLAVTASAALAPGNYNGTISPVAQNRITNNGDGTFTTAGNAGNQYALALADLSGLEDIDKASAVTVEFDTALGKGGRLLVGLGDKATRGTNANGSSKSSYNTTGLVMRFGATDNNYYRVNGGTNNDSAFDVTVHASVTLNRAEGKYSYTLKDGETTLFSASNVETTVDNITVIEAYSWSNSTTFTFSDVSVSYTIPEAPLHNYTINAVDAADNVIAQIATGSAGEASTYGADLNEVIAANDTYYTLDPSVTGFAVSYTMGTEDAVQTVRYIENNAIRGYKNAGHANAANSNGGYSVLATVPAGVYRVTVDLTSNANRGIYIRNKDLNDTANNVLTNFGIDKYSTAGIYSEEITVTEETTIGLTGFSTSGSTTKTNQSADYNYVILEYVGEYVAPGETKAFTFDGITADQVDGKFLSIKVGSADWTTPVALPTSTHFSGEGSVGIAIIISGIPADTTVSTRID